MVDIESETDMSEPTVRPDESPQQTLTGIRSELEHSRQRLSKAGLSVTALDAALIRVNEMLGQDDPTRIVSNVASPIPIVIDPVPKMGWGRLIQRARQLFRAAVCSGVVMLVGIGTIIWGIQHAPIDANGRLDREDPIFIAGLVVTVVAAISLVLLQRIALSWRDIRDHATTKIPNQS